MRTEERILSSDCVRGVKCSFQRKSDGESDVELNIGWSSAQYEWSSCFKHSTLLGKMQRCALRNSEVLAVSVDEMQQNC